MYQFDGAYRRRMDAIFTVTRFQPASAPFAAGSDQSGSTAREVSSVGEAALGSREDSVGEDKPSTEAGGQ